MLMLTDPVTGQVLIIDRQKKWKGYSFPGGHLEARESNLTSVKREFYEETGLRVTDPICVGLLHWYNENTNERYMEFLYKATKYSGHMLDGTDEGHIFWAYLETLDPAHYSQGFEIYLEMFATDDFKERFIVHQGQF